MKFFKRNSYVIAVVWFALVSIGAAQDAEPFMGRWALTLPNNGAGWLGLEQKEGAVEGSVLWGGGSVKPLDSVSIEGDSIRMTRIHKHKTKAVDGQPAQWKEITETLEGTLSGDAMKLVQFKPKADGSGVARAGFSAKRLAPLPPKPNLSKAQYGEPVHIFNGKDLSGWKLLHPSHKNGWSAKDGVLVNQTEPGAKGYGNLRTEAEFEDFKLTLDVLVPEKSNSGIFLRGMYEVQVLDSHGRPPDSHNMGGVYSRITPSQAVEKKHGEWQQMDITLLDQHVTVILNGVTIIDNQPLLGCTGGALSSDPSRPGPIILQGNHGSVEYKNLILTPIKS
jgi:hypothetical protein